MGVTFASAIFNVVTAASAISTVFTSPSLSSDDNTEPIPSFVLSTALFAISGVITRP